MTAEIDLEELDVCVREGSDLGDTPPFYYDPLFTLAEFESELYSEWSERIDFEELHTYFSRAVRNCMEAKE